MIAALSRALMGLAVHCLGDRRSDWAQAMQAEFEAAVEDGRPLAFASGCLLAAWRELPGHGEGRLAIASNGLAFLVIIPAAALLTWSILSAFPHSFLGEAGIHGSPLVSDGNRFALPSLTLLVVLLSGLQLRLAWLMLDRDWVRVTATGMLLASVTVTLLILTGIGFAHYASALAQMAVLAVELIAVAALARWHARLALNTS